LKTEDHEEIGLKGSLNESKASDAAGAAAKPARSILIDVLRGLAISLVVLGHTDEGMLHRHWWHASATGWRMKFFIYSFHMPAFFFVSGIFLCASVQKRGGWRFTTEKLRTMIYPYVVLACLSAPVILGLGRKMGMGSMSLRSYMEEVATGGFSWFLPTIFFTVVAGMLLRRIPMPLLFVLSVIASFYWPYTGLVFVDRGLKHLPFLVAGMWVGRSFERMERVPWVLAALGAVALFALILVITGSGSVYSPYLFIPLGLMGTLMLLLLAHCLGRTAAARLLSWAGAGSISIFMLSSYIQVAVRAVLVSVFHISAPYPQLLIPTILAVLAPAWIYQHRVRLHLEWVFVWPFRRKHVAAE
jgi:fucose 4-O-acetylase-like acetyltransferase